MPIEIMAVTHTLLPRLREENAQLDTTTTSAAATAANARKKKEAKVSDEDFQLPIVCDADTLRSLIRRKKSVRVVDVRKAEDYQREHIPTAVSLPLARV